MKLVNLDYISKTSAEESAAYWVMRLDTLDCGPTDRAAFEKWRTANASHAQTYARARQALALIDQNMDSMELMDLGEQVFVETGGSRKAFYQLRGFGLAVACTLFLGIVFYMQNGMQSDAAQQYQAAKTTFETAVGERSTATLPDDSIVALNTDTLIEVRFTQNSEMRKVILVRGQAHFDVEKDPRPFEVFAGGRLVVALGTAFDIRIDEQLGVLVTLEEGRVSVNKSEAPGATDSLSTRAVGTGRTFVLVAGEQLVAGSDGPPKVIIANMDQVAGWREGRLIFSKDSLADAVREINRYSTDKLFIDDDERLDSIQIGGSFKTGSTESFVNAVEDLHPVMARRVSSDRIALVWADKTIERTQPTKP